MIEQNKAKPDNIVSKI